MLFGPLLEEEISSGLFGKASSILVNPGPSLQNTSNNVFHLSKSPMFHPMIPQGAKEAIGMVLTQFGRMPQHFLEEDIFETRAICMVVFRHEKALAFSGDVSGLFFSIVFSCLEVEVTVRYYFLDCERNVVFLLG